MAQQKRQLAPLQIGHESFTFARSSNMPIALANKRLIQSAKGERNGGGNDYQFSAHRARQMVKLTSSATTSQARPQSQQGHSPGLNSTISSRSTAISTFDAKKQLENAFKIRSSAAMALSPVARPMSSGAFKPRKIEPTRFRYFYDRGDLPLRVNFAGAVRKLQWQVDLAKLDYSHYLPLFMEGLRDLDEPYQFLALNGTMDLLEKGENRTLACLALLVLPMKQNLMTRNPSVLCVQMKVLQKIVLCCPYVGEALVPYYRQLLSIFNLFITKRVNCGDKIDYGQRRQENLGDLVLETLNVLETHGGRDAFVNIKYVLAVDDSRSLALIGAPRLTDVWDVGSTLTLYFDWSRGPFASFLSSIYWIAIALLPQCGVMMKKRPVLTLLAVEDELRVPNKPRSRASKSDRKDGDDDNDDGDVPSEEEEEEGEIDELENSCDIGETTLRKGQIHINQTGVTFVSKPNHHHSHHARDNEIDEVSDEPLYQAKRKLIALEELETLGIIGRGCSGHVMRAKHHATNALYAVKLVNNVYDKAKRDQMLTEIRTLYSVESPYLVDFYGAYFKDHALSIVLEYCEAGSLDKLITKQQHNPAMPERVIAAMAFQMLMGLFHLKQTHHFHRDIKPQNILAKVNGKTKLTDFGIARELGNSQDMAQTFVGTFKYMSPERVQNLPYDYKSDIWSLGLVLIECATRTFPYYNARSYIDVVQSIIESPEPTLPDNDDDNLSFSDEFRDFISQYLKKNPQKRASVQDLLGSPWLKLHNATDGPTCVRICADWFASSSSGGSSKGREAKGGNDEDEENKYDDDEYEIEEDIEVQPHIREAK